MNWHDIEKHWPAMKASITARNPGLDADRLERTDSGRRRLLHLIEERYGATRPPAGARAYPLMKGEFIGTSD